MMKKPNIRHPQLWIGKYVRHMANWWDFAWNGDYFVCEWTGKLYPIEEEAYYGDYFDSLEDAYEAGFDPCYYYSHDGLMAIHDRFTHQQPELAVQR